MSRSFIKIVDLSLIPASMMILGKFLGIVLSIKIFNIPWTIKEYTDSLFTYSAAIKAEDIKIITSYSDLLMYVFLAALFSFNVVRAVYLHKSHIKPTLMGKLANKNLIRLVQNSYDIYHSSVVVLIFTWVGNLVILTNVIQEKTYLWIGILCFISTVVLTVLLFGDVYREIENIKKHPGSYQWQ